MKLGPVALALALSVAARAAWAAPQGGDRRVVVVAGPEGDAIAARLQKELAALGFETVRVGALEGCARSAVVLAALDSGAAAAACSDGEQVGIWGSEGGTLRLREVVVARDDLSGQSETDRARETTAVRAAEVTRATIAQLDAEARAEAPRPPPPQEAPRPAPIEAASKAELPPSEPARTADERYAPQFSASAGLSALMGVDASVGAFSAQIAVGVVRRVAVTARLEYPFESQQISVSQRGIEVAPAFAGAGVELPLFSSSSFIIPRFGAGVGAAWIQARHPATTELPQSFPPVSTEQRTEGTDSVASPAGYLSAAVSMRVLGPLRLTADGIFGTTLSRLVTREAGRHVAYWGQPLASLALRAEVMLR